MCPESKWKSTRRNKWHTSLLFHVSLFTCYILDTDKHLQLQRLRDETQMTGHNFCPRQYDDWPASPHMADGRQEWALELKRSPKVIQPLLFGSVSRGCLSSVQPSQICLHLALWLPSTSQLALISLLSPGALSKIRLYVSILGLISILAASGNHQSGPGSDPQDFPSLCWALGRPRLLSSGSEKSQYPT